MKSAETAKAKVAIVNERAIGAERELYEIKVQASKVEQEFRWQKERVDVTMDDAKSRRRSWMKQESGSCLCTNG